MTERKRPKRAKRGADTYAVGYGKPPEATQFKKGQPRPPRKPKVEKPDPSFEDYLADELKEPMQIVENGVELVVPKGKALAKASIKGAMQQKDPRRLKGFLRPPKAQEDFDFSDIDLAIVARALTQLLKQSQPPPGGAPDDGSQDEADNDVDDEDEEVGP